MLVMCVRMIWRMRVLVQQRPVITVTKDERFLKPQVEAPKPTTVAPVPTAEAASA
jgi:hypothetical protein